MLTRDWLDFLHHTLTEYPSLHSLEWVSEVVGLYRHANILLLCTCTYYAWLVHVGTNIPLTWLCTLQVLCTCMYMELGKFGAYSNQLLWWQLVLILLYTHTAILMTHTWCVFEHLLIVSGTCVCVYIAAVCANLVPQQVIQHWVTGHYITLGNSE